MDALSSLDRFAAKVAGVPHVPPAKSVSGNSLDAVKHKQYQSVTDSVPHVPHVPLGTARALHDGAEKSSEDDSRTSKQAVLKSHATSIFHGEHGEQGNIHIEDKDLPRFSAPENCSPAVPQNPVLGNVNAKDWRVLLAERADDYIRRVDADTSPDSEAVFRDCFDLIPKSIWPADRVDLVVAAGVPKPATWFVPELRKEQS